MFNQYCVLDRIFLKQNLLPLEKATCTFIVYHCKTLFKLYLSYSTYSMVYNLYIHTSICWYQRSGSCDVYVIGHSGVERRSPTCPTWSPITEHMTIAYANVGYRVIMCLFKQ